MAARANCTAPSDQGMVSRDEGHAAPARYCLMRLQRSRADHVYWMAKALLCVQGQDVPESPADAEQSVEAAPPSPTYHEVISKDEEATLRPLINVHNAAQAIAEKARHKFACCFVHCWHVGSSWLLLAVGMEVHSVTSSSTAADTAIYACARYDLQTLAADS